MTARRFLIWLLEKVIELHLAIAVLLLARIFLPLLADHYANVNDVARGLAEAVRGWGEDAAYQVATFVDGSWPRFLWHTYRDAAYTVLFYGYFGSLYVFTSLLAGLLANGRHVRVAVLAYVTSFAIFCARFVHVFDTDMQRMIAVLFTGGLTVVLVSAAIGARMAGGKPAPASGAGRVRLDFAD